MANTLKPVANAIDEWSEVEKQIEHLEEYFGTPFSKLRKAVDKCKDNYDELWDLSQSMMSAWEKLQEEQAKPKLEITSTMPKFQTGKRKLTPWSGL